MPKIYVTKTIGRNFVAGQIKDVGGAFLRSAIREVGNEDWFVYHDPAAHRHLVFDQATGLHKEPTAPAPKPEPKRPAQKAG